MAEFPPQRFPLRGFIHTEPRTETVKRQPDTTAVLFSNSPGEPLPGFEEFEPDHETAETMIAERMETDAMNQATPEHVPNAPRSTPDREVWQWGPDKDGDYTRGTRDGTTFTVLGWVCWVSARQTGEWRWQEPRPQASRMQFSEAEINRSTRSFHQV